MYLIIDIRVFLMSRKHLDFVNGKRLLLVRYRECAVDITCRLDLQLAYLRQNFTQKKCSENSFMRFPSKQSIYI